mgnify:CR=1 FL=1
MTEATSYTQQVTVIAVDGPAASGKGTLARRLADKLGFAYLDTGKLYRYVGRCVLDHGGDPGDAATATAMAEHIRDRLHPADLADHRLSGHAAGNAASKVAQFEGVRQALYDYQVTFAANPPDNAPGAVIDGRDIGTVIAPDADIKLYITASGEVRAQRRYQQLQFTREATTYDTILQDMKERDKRDSGRESAPMQAAEDAFVIDTSDMDIETAYNGVAEIVHNRLASHG